ncbi:hypothetical protein [Pseudonocardia sp. NPDC049635]|uniref:hypothetical protein n=1 Tax=Pseudonocardia sp. NPDC049635 TaxID=3155506 RepID=UPI0033FEA490
MSPLAAPEAHRALEALTTRVRTVSQTAGDRFPLFAVDGEWVLSRRGSWLPGIWVGLLALVATVTGDPADRSAAESAAGRLEPRLADDTVTRAVTFWYGAAGTGARDRELRVRAARALLASRTGTVVPVGRAWGRTDGDRLVEIDCWGPLVRLLTTAAPDLDPAHAAAARATARAQTAFHLRHGLVPGPDGLGVVDMVRLGPAPAPDGPARHTGRGVAWAALGLAEAARQPGPAPDGLRAALDALPYTTALQEDSSATAITTVALFKLAHTLGDATRLDQARALLAGLVRHRLSRDPPHTGVLTGSRYRTVAGDDQPVESVWGAFFLVLALAVETGLVDPFAL